jgi:hypothetical protein
MHAEVAECVFSFWATGLIVEEIKEAIVQGEAERDSTTAFDVPIRAGFDAWAETVRALRAIKVPQGWIQSDDKNVSLTISPNMEHAIQVMAGDRYTGLGDPHLVPQPKNQKGEATAFVVESAQLSLFGARTTHRLRKGPIVWFLLIHRVPGKDEVRAELSLPASMLDGYVTTWHHRHNLGTIQLGPKPTPKRDGDGPSDINVEVRRKS